MRPGDWMVRYRAMAGNILLVVLLILATPDISSIIIGFVLILAGTVFRGWASGFIAKDSSLATQGPYALTRNPLYFGSFIIGMGIAIAGNNLYSYGIFLTYFLVFFPYIMVVEYRRMKERFGKEFEEWAEDSHVFFPRVRKIRSTGFNISLYMRNREYRVIYFSLIVILVFIFKYIDLLKLS